MKKIFLAITFLIVTACQTNLPLKFDKEKWQIKENDNYKYRKEMVHDLINNIKLKGLTRNELIDLLGKSENMWKTDKELFYPILKKYDEPIHIIFLAVRINKKEIVDHFEIIDNRKIKTAPRKANLQSLPINYLL
jgi:hypothetical protein